MVKQLLVVFLVSLLPLVSLLLRGVGWGNDSFYYYSIVPLPFLVICFAQWLLYFFVLLSLWEISKPLFKEKAWLLPVYVGTLTPLFFIEALRFENDFFGWGLMLVAIGLFSKGLGYNWFKKAICIIISIGMACFSVYLWLGSLLLTPLALTLVLKNLKVNDLLLFIGLIVSGLLTYAYILGSFNFTNPIAEEIPLVGLIFIIHVIHLWKKIPQPYTFYGIILLCVGLLKPKYLFLATPFLLMPLLLREKQEITIRGKTVPIMFFVILLGFGWISMATQMYPTQTDLQEIQTLINQSKNQNLPLYNDWQSGWFFTYLGFDTNYKSSYPDPDWNKLSKPYLAYSKQEIPCQKLTKNSYYCE